MRALKNNRGLTLIEVMVAMAISFIVFLGLTDAVLVALDANLRNAMRDEGVRVAESEMNAVRNTPFADIVAADDNVVRNFRHLTKTYRVVRSVTAAGPDMRQVVVTVSWTRGTRTDNTVFTTIVRDR